MATRISDAAANAAAIALNTTIGANARVEYFTGSQPATADTAASGTKLATATASTVFGTVASRTLTSNAIADATISASGTPGYVRISTSAGVAVVDLAVGAGEVVVDDASFVATNSVKTNSVTIQF